MVRLATVQGFFLRHPLRRHDGVGHLVGLPLVAAFPLFERSIVEGMAGARAQGLTRLASNYGRHDRHFHS
jgi:hypothetical protein